MIKNIQKNLIEKNDHLLLSISGGIDSMVMLHNILSIKDEQSLTLTIAHINHQKRPTSQRDALFVKNEAKKHGLPFYLHTLTDDDYENFHDYAHYQRFDFLNDLAKKVKANKIVLAHHLDDLAETIIMRLIRGSSFEGYRGMLPLSQYKGTSVIRPLLKVKKDTIKAYQLKHQIDYVVDESNQSDHYTRNRFRHHIMPLLEKENPKYLEKISQFSDYQDKAYTMIYHEAKQYIDQIDHKDDQIIFSASHFSQLYELVQIEVIKQMINDITNNQVELSFQQLNDIIDLINKEKPHLMYEQNQLLYIYKSYDDIMIQNHPKKHEDYHFTIRDLGLYHINDDIEVYIAKKPNKTYDYIYKLCYNNLDLLFPIEIRNRRPGDRLDIQIGTKKLKDFFIEKKIPMEQRDRLPLIIQNKNQILFIPDLYAHKTSGKNSIYIHMNQAKI